MKIMTGKTGTPHVTSQQFRQLIEGTVGQDSYILQSGENLEPELQTNNLLKIRSGMMSHHGNLSGVDIGTYDEVTIANGTQGRQRIDLVVNRYTRDESTGVEENAWVVIQGAAVTSDPVDPSYIEGNLQEGDLVDDCPVFRIHLNGINVTEVEKLLSVTPNIPTLNASLSKKEPKQERTNSGYYYKNGYSCFLHTSNTPARDVITTLPESYRPCSAITVSGWCRNNSNRGYFPCVGSVRSNGTWAYLSVLNESLGQDTPYYIYNDSDGTDNRSNYTLWLTGAWATNVNGA